MVCIMITKQYLKTLKQAEVAALYDVDVKTIQRWHADGFPRHGEGRGQVYVWEECQAWQKARMSPNQDGMTDREREQCAKADIAEMEAAEMAGKLLDREKTVSAWIAVLGRMKDNLMGLPERVAPKIEPEMVLAERQAMLRSEMIRALRELADMEGLLQGEAEHEANG